MKEAFEYLDKVINKNTKYLVVAVSFGPDSMALLDLLCNKYPNTNIVCAHVHHNHRAESDKEALDLKQYCKDNNIIFEMMKIDSYTNNKFTEEEARIKRYEFFDDLMKKYGATYLFTAHHGDDLVETVLMRLVRGSTIKGYSGIPLISDRNGYKIVRPLSYTTKKDLEEYCVNKNIPFAVDKSNNDLEYTRNRYRKNILPLLKEENKNVHKQFIKFSEELQECDKYVENASNDAYNNAVDNNIIDIKKLKKEENIIIKRVIQRYLYNIYGSDINKISDSHTELIINILMSDKASAEVSLPDDIIIVKSYNKLYYDKKVLAETYDYIINSKIALPNNYSIKKINNLENTTNYVTCFDSNEIALPLHVRNKQDGDKIEVLGLNGNKKITDIFITEKVPTKLRLTYPVVYDNNNIIIWIPGLKKSKYDKSKYGNYDIILKYYKEENNDTTK